MLLISRDAGMDRSVISTLVRVMAAVRGPLRISPRRSHKEPKLEVFCVSGRRPNRC